ncbi:MAG TPA: VOC family protein [Mycobacterium sp.]|jgi:catechol 2,3-dioxygenase-like lactoylglutathione lyase family enzyme|nr:VOC family protein [Mycobacterium sp.]
MDYTLEVIELPVNDVDRSLRFYTEQLGFNLDVDYQPNPHFRVVQLTPPGSACSLHLESAAIVAPHTHYLVVTDLALAQQQLHGRGVELHNVRHKSPLDTWAGGWEPGIDPEHHDYASLAQLTDPDGHVWVIQERGYTP